MSSHPSWMPSCLYQGLLGLVLTLLLLIALPPAALAQAAPADLAQAVQEIEALDAMRSNLAASLEGQAEPPTLETMKTVCRPVGMRAKQLSQEHGWQVKQMATKYRNPDHAPDSPQAEKALAQFEQNPDLMGFWQREAIAGQSGSRYYRRINVEAGCLACHGQGNDRPQFIKDNYPNDLAYDFEVGALRGMYAVFLPDVQGALVDAVRP